MQSTLRITEIFLSIQGESLTVGLPTVFIRLTGCPLRCTYCDTAYAFQGGIKMTIDEIIEKVKEFGTTHITVTGGEPLAQRASHTLLNRLCDEGYQVSLETSGAMDISEVDKRVMTVLDLKTPASNEEGRNLLSNLVHLKQHDQIKFVICNRGDYEWAREMVEKHALSNKADVLFSPSWEEQPLSTLAQWILDDRLTVRFQIQLHKVIWPNEDKGR